MMRMRFLFILLAMISSYLDVSVLALGHSDREVRQVKVGFVSSLNDRWGKMGLNFTNMAISDFYEQHPHYKTRLLVQVRDSQGNDVVASAKAVEELIKEEVVAIIGPETSQEAQFDIRLGEKYKVPIISYSASSPMLSSPYFIQATQDDSSQVQAISSIIQAFGWREVTPIYVNNEFGGGMIPSLVDALQQFNTRIPYRSVLSSSATREQIKKELSNLRKKQTRVFVVHMNETLASLVFRVATESGMMTPEYVWIITSNIANALGTLDHKAVTAMEGVLGVKTYVPFSDVTQRFNRRWNKSFNLDSSDLQKIIYGLWAYDATFLLAEAVEQVGQSNITFQKEVSNVGPKLIELLVNTTFQGLSGNFSLANGKLQASTFDIINVIGTGEHNIGYWTQQNGLVRNFNGSSTETEYSTSKANLSPAIIWPGDKTATPKGWAIPTEEKPLKIGVPVKIGFTEFVKATLNEPNPTGFCIGIFEAVKNTLQYDLPVKYIPDNCSYDELVTKVYNGEYDAVVGDVTIVANRSLYVDFTLPYMESDILMVVPAVVDNKANKAFAFLRPLSLKLWITSLCFFILIAFVIWVNEYQINDEFRAESWKAQIGQCLFYSFSTMVFSHKEAPKSNLSRFVMVLWVFTLLLLTQSYTASLSAMLTAEKLRPAYKEVSELLGTRKRVGYQKGTFVRDYLHRLGFDETNTVPYETVDDLNNLLSNGSDKGGVDAAFDEAPYMKLFLAYYCSKYMTVRPPTANTDGFAFVFPIGSPLVSDFSRGVLNVTEGVNMTAMWDRWLKRSEDCPIDSASITDTSSGTLELDSFLVLFGITGGACVAAVVYKVVFFLYENRRVLKRNGGMSLKERLHELNKSFHRKRGSVVRDKFEDMEMSSRGSSPLHLNSVLVTELEVIDNVEVVTVPPSSSPSPSSSSYSKGGDELFDHNRQ